jgi:O-antigen/teichoic acid export membrane protein
MLWAAGRTRAQVTYAWVVAALNLGLSIWFTSLWGLEGVVIGTTAAYLIAFPLFIHYTVEAFPITVKDLAREAWLPAYSVAAGLGAALIALNAVADLSSPAALVATGAASVSGYWAVFYALWLRPEERVFFKQLLGNLTRRR